MVLKAWLAYSPHYAPIQTWVSFFAYRDPITNHEGPRCHLQVSKIGPPMGPEDRPAWVGRKSCDFGVTSNDPWAVVG